ncbi:MAG TPA: hypothetical protein VFD70_26370 [Anaerolineae bacterium]|nr:hypothetical protein [Anaerolineae bacterium]
MRGLFTARGCLPLWAIFIGLLVLNSFLKSLISELEAAHVQATLVTLLNNINAFVPNIVLALASSQLPETIELPGVRVVVTRTVINALIGFGFVLFGANMMRRAIKSKSIADDFLALLGFYICLRVAIQLWFANLMGLDLAQSSILLVVMIGWIGYATWQAKGLDDSKIFFRGLLLIGVVLLFDIPDLTIGVTLGILTRIAELGADLIIPAWFQLLGVIGLLVGVYLLYGVGTKPKRSARQALDQVQKDINQMLDKAKEKEE